MKKKFKIEVDCAACAAKVEDAIRRVEGVDYAVINFITQKMTLEADESVFEDVLATAVKAAKRIEPDFEVEF